MEYVTSDFVRDVHDKALTALDQIKFSKRDRFDHAVVSYYATMLELSDSICTLIALKKPVGIGTLARSFMEAYVDLSNLISDEKYINHLHSNYHKQWLKVLEEAAKGSNPFLAGMSNLSDFNDQLERHKSSLAKLRLEGFPALRVDQRFARAGMGDTYRSIYNIQCGEAHNDIRALMSRHIEINAEKDDYEIAIYQQPVDGEFEAELDSIAGMLIGASVNIHDHFGSGATDELHGLKAKLDDLRSARDT